MLNNWINNPLGLSLLDKIKLLLEIPHKLVLVQVHELERLMINANRHQHSSYINNLYDHYITKKLGKTYE